MHSCFYHTSKSKGSLYLISQVNVPANFPVVLFDLTEYSIFTFPSKGLISITLSSQTVSFGLNAPIVKLYSPFVPSSVD